MSSRVGRHFDRAEFACRCGCGYDDIDPLLVLTLDDIRDYYRRPIIITSGCRCAAHNRSVAGSPSSQHLVGRASDFIVRGVSASDVQDYLIGRLTGYGIGRYHTWTHIDTRGHDALWDMRS